MRECKRGYFQFSSREDGLYLTVYPPEEGSQIASINDALYYLEKRSIVGCDTVQINRIFAQARYEVYSEKILDTAPNPINSFGDYRISMDTMEVHAVFYPPFEGASDLTENEICRDLENMGIRYGILQENIHKFVETKTYGDSFMVAQGKQPRHGKDGYIEYKFNPQLKPTPKMNEDGTVDFHTLESVNHIKKGDVVAVLHPEDVGDEGIDVLGRSVMPRKVKHVIFRNGRNLTISEDGLSLISMVSGHVMLENEKIFVSNVLELVDVDASTGDIDYDGSVNIKGNVLAGFSVKASGDVSVSGIVEGASIRAGGTITFNRGVQGMNKAIIVAGGNIISKFIEGAELVQAGGYIETDSILHSKVMANGPITASGRNGLIVGGEVRSLVMIEAKTIGNEMGTATVVGVGVDPAMKKRLDELKKELDKLGNNKIQLNQILSALRKRQELDGKLDPEKKELQQKTMRNVIILENQLNIDKKEYDEIRQHISEDKNARIKVNRTAYVGTKLVFGDQYLFIKQKYDYCQFIKERADIKNVAL
jgi:uncharacterized protein (DUF342 family)